MYEIKIKRVTIVKKTVEGNWTIVDKRPYTQEEYNKACEPFQNLPDSTKELIKEVHGYAPPTEKEVSTETLILHQFVEDLDINSVIIAINKLGEEKT